MNHGSYTVWSLKLVSHIHLNVSDISTDCYHLKKIKVFYRLTDTCLEATLAEITELITTMITDS